MGSDDQCCATQLAKLPRMFCGNISFVQRSSVVNISIALILVSDIATDIIKIVPYFSSLDVIFLLHDLQVSGAFLLGKIIPRFLCAQQGVPELSRMFWAKLFFPFLPLSTRCFHNSISGNNYGNLNKASKCPRVLSEFTVNNLQ